jgi:hypothetical protein
VSRETPSSDALTVVAATVRFNALEIFSTPTFFLASPLKFVNFRRRPLAPQFGFLSHFGPLLFGTGLLSMLRIQCNDTLDWLFSWRIGVSGIV